MDCFIGLDIGTSSVKGMLLSEKAIVKTASREYPLYYPKDGWSEQNPQDWYDGSISVIKELVSDIDKNSVVSISFSGQMHGLVVLDENDNVIRPAILWNDSRSSLETEYLNNIIGKKTLQQNRPQSALAQKQRAGEFSKDGKNHAPQGLCSVQAKRRICDRLLRRYGHIVFRHKKSSLVRAYAVGARHR